MKRTALLALVGLAALSIGAAQAHAELWGKLNPRKTGAWARNKVMRKGFLASLVKQVAKNHAAYAKDLGETLSALNGYLGKCHGRWPNFRLALANLMVGATPPGAGIALASIMKPSLDAVAGGCPKVGKGGMVAVIEALKTALPELKKAKRRFKKHVRVAMGWMKKGNLWAKGKKKRKPKSDD